MPFKSKDLVYAATSRCPCGAGLAYVKAPRKSWAHAKDGTKGSWDCSAILLGEAIPSGQPGAVQHTDRLPFAFYEIKPEHQPSADGRTTRPARDEHEWSPRTWRAMQILGGLLLVFAVVMVLGAWHVL